MHNIVIKIAGKIIASIVQSIIIILTDIVFLRFINTKTLQTPLKIKKENCKHVLKCYYIEDKTQTIESTGYNETD